ncbi:MAG TPA: hypothetical protein VG841_05095 [Caulobacterales bacterium]|nr:hypothetical protein [Caulobacterales bacterium]
MSSMMKEALRDLSRAGFTATRTRRGHWRFEHPLMDGPVFTSGTPSDHRSLKNLRAQLRRRLPNALI